MANVSTGELNYGFQRSTNDITTNFHEGVEHKMSSKRHNKTYHQSSTSKRMRSRSRRISSVVITKMQIDRRLSIFRRKLPKWGWMCVLGSFFIHAVVQGCLGRTTGLLQIRMEETFGQTTADTAWVFSISIALKLLLAPLVSTVCRRFSCKVATVAGGVLLAMSLLISAFTPNLWLLYLSYGVLGGAGSALVSGPAVIIVGQYYKDISGFPIGIATSGSGVGSFGFPFLVEVMFEYYGFTGTFLVLSGIALNMCVCGMLFRPISSRSKALLDNIRIVNKKSKYENKSPSQCNKKSKFGEDSMGQDELSSRCNKDEHNRKRQKTKKTLFNFRIFKNPKFVLFCFAMMFATANRCLHFVPSMAISKGLSQIQAAFLLSVSGISEIISRIILGLILDFKRLRPHRLLIYNLMTYALGLIAFFFPYIETFEMFGVAVGLYGSIFGVLSSQKSVVIMDLIGAQNLCEGNGVLTFSRGLGVLIGPPFAGLLKDIYGGYTETMFLSGAFAIASSVLLSIGSLALCLRNRILKNHTEQSKTTDTVLEQYRIKY